MTIREVLHEQIHRLSTGGIESARLDCQVLAAHLLGKDKSWLLAHEGDTAPARFGETLEKLIDRRCTGETVAYIVGHKEFFGHSFDLGPGVLIPRPETEILVEWVLETESRPELEYLDICTGTACIPLSLGFERPRWHLHAGDVSNHALVWARMNIERLLPGRIQLRQSNLFAAFQGQTFDVVTANPPYVPHKETLERISEGWKEPALALDGGEFGTELLSLILMEAPSILKPGAWMFLEFGDGQAESLLTLSKSLGYDDIGVRQDLAGLPRILRVRKPKGTS